MVETLVVKRLAANQHADTGAQRKLQSPPDAQNDEHTASSKAGFPFSAEFYDEEKAQHHKDACCKI